MISSFFACFCYTGVGLLVILVYFTVKSSDADDLVNGKGEKDRAALGLKACNVADSLHNFDLEFLGGEEEDAVGLLGEGGTHSFLDLGVVYALGMKEGRAGCAGGTRRIDGRVGIFLIYYGYYKLVHRFFLLFRCGILCALGIGAVG